MATVVNSIALQTRDFLLLQGLFDSRVMTLAHISSLYFEGRDESAKKRMQKLKAAGFVSERPRRVYEPAVLFLAQKGFQALYNGGHLSQYPQLSWKAVEKRVQVSELTLRHELEIQEVKIALTLAINTTGSFRIAEFSTWPLLYEFRVTIPANGSTFSRSEILLKPDGFIRIMEIDANGQEFRRLFFLEVDRSTETLNKVVTKAMAYREYYRTGGLAKRFAATRDSFSEYPFRVLMVFKSEERRQNVAEKLLLLNPPILKQCWLATLKDVMKDPLEEIWKQPADSLTGKMMRIL